MDSQMPYHALVERQIAAETNRPLLSTLVLQRLKRQKLLVKDEIDSWERLMGALRA